MKRVMLLALAVLSASSCLLAQTTKNPFSELGYKKHITYTSSKGEFEEFHDKADIVEIGSVYFNTKTNKVVGYVNEEKEKAEVASATSAMSVDPHCEKYYWISPYAYCLNNPVRYIDPDGKDPYLVYNGTTKTLSIYDDNKTIGNYKDDKILGTFDARNNVASNSKGKWEDGSYEMQDKTQRATHNGRFEKDGKTPQDSKNGGYGEGGIYRAKTFKETTTDNTRAGMAVHAGREYKDLEKRVTMGCVRTTPEAMKAIDNAIEQQGPLQSIIIQNNRESKNSASVNNINPGTNKKEDTKE